MMEKQKRILETWVSAKTTPLRVETFNLSRDKHFVEKLTDVVGVYVNPPDKAVVLFVDEKTQEQESGRTQSGLPMKKGAHGTMTHGYKRNCTTCLFAALNLLEEVVEPGGTLVWRVNSKKDSSRRIS